MKKSTCAFLALAAGSLLTTAAHAQIEAIPFPPGTIIQHMEYNEADGVLRPVTGDYTGRAPTVYDSEATAPCGIYFAGMSNIIDDVSFGPVGPWAATTNNVLRTITVPYANSGTTPISYSLRITIWDNGSFSNNPMIGAAEVPLYRATIPLANIPAANAYFLTITPTVPPTLPDNNVFVQLEYFTFNTTTLLSNAAGTPAKFFGVSLVTTGPGSSTNAWGLDINNNGIFAGGAVTSTEHRRSVFPTGSAAGCVGLAINLPIVLTGDVPVTPPSATSLGALTDTLNRTDALTAGQVRWYSFTLNSDVSDAARTFLDIYTQGPGVTNTAMALFNTAGNIISSDELGGEDDYSQLSFGIGRRAANGNGEQFDGYDGELLATGGTFYLAVCEGNATFSDGFIVTPVSPGTSGNINLRMRSNVVSNVLAASVAPEGTDVGQILGPGTQTVATLPGVRRALWYKFNICRDIVGADSEDYLDIDFGAGDSSSDAIAYIFNTAGNLLYTSDDSSPTNAMPIFSFGSAGPRGPYTPNSEPSIGADGALTAGDYYMAVGLFNMTALPDPIADGRWHVRPLSGSNLNIRPDFYTGVLDCNPTCSPCPADFNLSGGVDGDDVQAFFETWEQGLPCGDTNFDGSVDGSDVEGFFVPWEAGGC